MEENSSNWKESDNVVEGLESESLESLLLGASFALVIKTTVQWKVVCIREVK